MRLFIAVVLMILLAWWSFQLPEQPKRANYAQDPFNTLTK